MPNLVELASRADIVPLVDAFYERVREDKILSSIFTDVARVDWEVHLPKMYDFWESVLFGKEGFKGAPLPVHLALSRQVALTSREFDRWIALFHSSVDALFAGPTRGRGQDPRHAHRRRHATPHRPRRQRVPCVK